MRAEPRNILGYTSDEVEVLAKQEVASGAGLARKLHRTAMLTGRFEPEQHGLVERSVAAWRGAFALNLPEVVKHIEEPTEHGAPTAKVVLRTHDGLEIECVRIPMPRGRFTLCVSSQVGCRLGCGFCETAKMGLLRNLTAAEIVGQVVVARSVLGWEIRNIVFMGMGEPLDNTDELLHALRILNDRRGLSYGQQHITVCTAGRPDGIERLAELGWKRLDLSISLNAAIDSKRDRLMPVNRRYPLAQLQRALIEYPRRDKFVYAINYCLLPGLNDTFEDAQAVAEFCRPLGRVLVNVIPYNPGTRPLTRAPEEPEIAQFLEWVEQTGIPVRRRITRGRSVMAACGQLGNVELRKTRLRIAD